MGIGRNKIIMSNNRSGVFIGGLMLGAAIGTLAGLLVAPRTGRETRKLLQKSANTLPELAEDLATNVQIQADRLSSTALKNWDETLERMKEAISVGIDVTQREQQSLNRQNPVDVTTTAENSASFIQNLERSQISSS
jgi:gas vesicle protein